MLAVFFGLKLMWKQALGVIQQIQKVSPTGAFSILACAREFCALLWGSVGEKVEEKRCIFLSLLSQPACMFARARGQDDVCSLLGLSQNSFSSHRMWILAWPVVHQCIFSVLAAFSSLAETSPVQRGYNNKASHWTPVERASAAVEPPATNIFHHPTIRVPFGNFF